jgi:hypothetical protein
MKTATLMLLFAGALALGAVACKKEDDAGTASPKTAAPTQKTSYTCKIQIKKKLASPEVKGTADGTDEKATTDKAWADACGKLAEADRADCHDDKKFSASVSSGSATSGGKTNYNVNVTLTAIAPMFEGKGVSDASEDDACKLATDEACKQAGDKPDCVASGAWEAGGKMTSKETKLQ